MGPSAHSLSVHPHPPSLSCADRILFGQPFWGLCGAFFIATLYISLDTAFGWTKAFGVSNPPIAQKNIPLFVLTTIWPGVYVPPSHRPISLR